jgi:hypothetical protein
VSLVSPQPPPPALRARTTTTPGKTKPARTTAGDMDGGDAGTIRPVRNSDGSAD